MILSADKISYSHRKFKILNQIDLEINKGELLVFIGPNGAGKSTLLNVLSREIKASYEQLLFKNKPLKDWNNKELAYYKAKFSQENNHDIGLEIKDIVLMGRYPYFESVPNSSDWEIVHKSMKMTEVFHLKNRMYNSLSGGEKQRVHLARVMAQIKNEYEEKILFFDEPLNNLDIRHQFQVLKSIKAFTKKGNAAVVVLHDLNLASEYGDQLLLLKKGEVVVKGTPKEVINEKIISETYDIPCTIINNPISNHPMILFQSH